MMFIYKIGKFALVWTTILKVRAIFVHQTLTEHALSYKNMCRSSATTLWDKKYVLEKKGKADFRPLISICYTTCSKVFTRFLGY